MSGAAVAPASSEPVSRRRAASAGEASQRLSICFVGLANLPVLAQEFGEGNAGGAELQQTVLAKALARRGHRISMVVYDHGQPDGAAWHGVTTYRAYRPDAGVWMLRFIHPRWTSIWSALARADADIYYVSCAGMLIGEAAVFARRHGRKVVYRVAHDTDCDPRTAKIRYRRDRLLYAHGLRSADLVLAQTARQQQLLTERFGLSSRVIPSVLAPAGRRRRFEERDIDVLWVANIRAWKRPERLLDLARRLPHLRFHMAGGCFKGCEEIYESVRRGAHELPNVHFHGQVRHDRVHELFERARVLAGTSESEGFPNTYMQAWAHGAPVVSFLDPEQLIARHTLGRVVGSLEQMRTAIEPLCRDEQAWTAASRRCAEYFDRRYDEQSMIAPYLDALSRLHARG